MRLSNSGIRVQCEHLVLVEYSVFHPGATLGPPRQHRAVLHSSGRLKNHCSQTYLHGVWVAAAPRPRRVDGVGRNPTRTHLWRLALVVGQVVGGFFDVYFLAEKKMLINNNNNKCCLNYAVNEIAIS